MSTKITEKELKKLIKEELDQIDEIFNIPFLKGSSGSQRTKPTRRGLSKTMTYDDFLDGLDKKGQAAFDSAASYSDMKDARQDKAFDKMDANTRDMVLDSHDMTTDRLAALEQGMENIQKTMNAMYQKIMSDLADTYPDPEDGPSTPESAEAIAAAVGGKQVPGKRKAFGQQFENRKRRGKQSR